MNHHHFSFMNCGQYGFSLSSFVYQSDKESQIFHFDICKIFGYIANKILRRVYLFVDICARPHKVSSGLASQQCENSAAAYYIEVNQDVM